MWKTFLSQLLIGCKMKVLPECSKFNCSLSDVQADQLELLFTSCVLLAADNFCRVAEENNDLPCLSKQMCCCAAAWKQRELGGPQ